MSGPLIQQKRIATLDTPAGRDRLVLTRFEGEEAIDALFEYRIDALSQEENIDFDPMIGRTCTVTVESYDGVKRYFSGILTEGRWVGISQTQYAYQLVLRPWLWLLGRKSDCRIFKDRNAIDVIEDVLNRGGFSDFVVKASRGDYKKLEYCVQYRETDLAFVRRLMEEFGLYAFFEHEPGKHRLVLADARSCHGRVAAGGGSVPFLRIGDRNPPPQEHLHHWSAERCFRTGRMALNDFDYMKPTTNLRSESQASERYERSQLEIYDYPGRYTEQGEGCVRAKVRLQAEQAFDRRKHAAGDAISLFPGGLVDLKQHPTDDREYLVLRARHVLSVEAFRTGVEAHEPTYQGTYEFLPSDRPYRLPLATPRPLVHGPQTALVVARKGKEGEEIDVDEEGRVFLQFHWNRDRDRISRPVRVAQMWSGKSWGWQVIPRVGQEVVVEYLEGNPDQPLVVGTVYNKDFRHPYELPDEKTKSGVKSDSTKGHNGFNELMFDDRKNGELVRLRAERDHETVVRNAETRTIGEAFAGGLGRPSRSTTLKNGDDTLAVESGDWRVDVGESIEIRAGRRIVLSVGASRITMDPGSIRIQSGDVAIDSLVPNAAPSKPSS